MISNQNMFRVVAGADVGNENIQIVTAMNDFIMKNKITLDTHQDLELTSNTYNVVYNGRKYVVGDDAECFHSKDEGKATELHLIATLTAFAAAVKTNARLNIVTGESFNYYQNAEHKAELQRLYSGVHKIKVNNKDFVFDFENTFILPESAGIRILNANRVKGEVGHVLDLGSSTINYCEYLGIAPQGKKFALPFGMHNIVSNIRHDLMINKFGNVVENQIKNYLKDTSKIANPTMREIFEKSVYSQLRKLDAELSAQGLNVRNLIGLEFTGGTTLELKEFLINHYKPNTIAISEDPLWDNARGFYKFANNKYNK